METWTKMSFCCLILVSLSQMVISVSPFVFSQETIDIYKYCSWSVKDVGCPIHNDIYWDCLRDEFDCPEGTEYHCVRMFDDKTKFVDGCAPHKTCLEGEAPYLIREKDGQPTEDFHIRCDWCNGDTYNSLNRLSSTYSECWNKIRCDSKHGIECVPENRYDQYWYKQDRLCRCDARNNYVLSDTSRLDWTICTSDSSIASHCIKKEPCGKNEERLLDYTCALKCENGYRSEKSDICIPFSSQAVPSSTDKPSVTENLNNTTETMTTSTTIQAITKSVISSTERTFTSPTLYLETIVKHVPDFTIIIVVCVIVGIVVIAVLAVIMYRKYRKRQGQAERDREVPLLGKAYFEVIIHVTSEEFSSDIERARPHVSRLTIARRLQDALKNELSSNTEVKDVFVTDIRSGSQIVVFLIETEGLCSEKCLKLSLSKILKKGKSGEFTVDRRHFKFAKYPDLAPIPRRPSVIEAVYISPLLHRPRIKRAYSSPASFPNGDAASVYAPLANQTDEFKGLTDVSEAEDEIETQSHVEFTLSSPSSPEEPMPAAFLFSVAPQQPLPARTGNNTYIREHPCLEPAVRETMQSLLPSSSRSIKDGTEKRVCRMRRRSSSCDFLGLPTEYSPPPLKLCQSLLGLDENSLDEVAKQTLDKHRGDLLKCLQPDAILDQFSKDNFMKDTDIRDIREEKTTTEKIRKIIDAVKHRGHKGFHKLMEIIRFNQLDLAKVEREFKMGLKEIQAHPEKYQAEDKTDDDTDDTDTDTDMDGDTSA